MRNRKKNESAFHSDGQMNVGATKQPCDLIQIIDDFLQTGGSTEPVEKVNFLMCEFIVNKDDQQWDQVFVANTIFETARIVNFITKLHECRKGAY